MVNVVTHDRLVTYTNKKDFYVDYPFEQIVDNFSVAVRGDADTDKVLSRSEKGNSIRLVGALGAENYAHLVLSSNKILETMNVVVKSGIWFVA